MFLLLLLSLITTTIISSKAQEEVQDCRQSVIDKLIVIAADPIINQCTQASGFRFIASGGIPASEDQYNLVCTQPSCKEAYSKAKDLNITSCSLLVENKLINFRDRIDEVIETCAFDFTNSIDTTNDDDSTSIDNTIITKPIVDEPSLEQPPHLPSTNNTTLEPDNNVVERVDDKEARDENSASFVVVIGTTNTITTLLLYCFYF